MFSWETGAAQTFGLRNRRNFLRAGFLGFGGLTWADMLRQQAAAATPPRDTQVLLLFVHGGPSHLETYDLKPLANADIRGPFSPISTNVPGIEICEHLPRHAEIAHRFTLIRSCSHDEADHFAGHRRLLSGYGKLKPGFGYESHYPQVGAIVNKTMQGQLPRGLPPAIAVGGVVVNGPDYAAGISEGFLNSIYRVPIVNGGLRDANLAIDSQRFDNRLALRQGLDRLRRDLDVKGTMEVLDDFNRQAVELLTTGAVRRAFDLNLEHPKVVETYGPGWGKEVLTGLRLVEAGVKFVTVRIPGSAPGNKSHDWDDHAVNWDMPSSMLARLPRYDQVVTQVINDLYDRGLDKRVLLIVTGEFGRTPRLEFKDGRTGRDHWPGAMSILISGGGMPMGQVIGKTDRIGGYPTERKFDPHDLLATIYRYLGIETQQNLIDPAGRPIPLTRGEPIAELF